MEFKTFSCFDNFVRGNNAGVPDHTPMNHALQHLEKWVHSIQFKKALINNNCSSPQTASESIAAPDLHTRERNSGSGRPGSGGCGGSGCCCCGRSSNAIQRHGHLGVQLTIGTGQRQQPGDGHWYIAGAGEYHSGRGWGSNISDSWQRSARGSEQCIRE